MLIFLWEWIYLRFVLLFIVLLLFFLSVFWQFLKSNRAIKNWNTVEHAIDEMKKDMMEIYLLTEKDYMQCMVGIWIISLIENDDIKKLMRLKESTDFEKKASKKTIACIKDDQKSIRFFFLVNDKAFKKVWGRRYLASLINLLKEEPSCAVLNETERSVVDTFYKKYKNIEHILKEKTNFKKLTFVENAIRRVPDIFEVCIVKSSE